MSKPDMTARDQLVEDIAEALNVDHAPDGTTTPAHQFFWEASLADARVAVEVMENAGWRPPARTVSTVEELATLSLGTVVIDAHQRAFQRFGDGWEATGLVGGHEVVARPAIVLWEPEEGE